MELLPSTSKKKNSSWQSWEEPPLRPSSTNFFLLCEGLSWSIGMFGLLFFCASLLAPLLFPLLNLGLDGIEDGDQFRDFLMDIGLLCLISLFVVVIFFSMAFLLKRVRTQEPTPSS